VTSSNDVLGTSQLASVGLDSLSMVELLGRVRGACGVDISPSKLTMTTTVDELARMVIAGQQQQQQQVRRTAVVVLMGGGCGVHVSWAIFPLWVPLDSCRHQPLTWTKIWLSPSIRLTL
jgi:acyl carrier protein